VKACSEFVLDRIANGFGSGEALCDTIAWGNRPPPGPDEDGTMPEDDSPFARHTLMVEPEFARILAVNKRDGSTLAPLLRQGWDGGQLAVRSRTATTVVNGGHLTVIAHITRAELLAKVAESDIHGGTLNRFLLIPARRSKDLPSGGNLDDRDLAPLVQRFGAAVAHARSLGVCRIGRSADAEDYWDTLYRELLTDEPGGLLGAVTARNTAQVLRLSLAYALLDRARRIEVEHIAAAQALWAYSRAGAALIFGERTGNPVADKILEEVQSHPGEGLDGTAVRDLLGRHATREQIARAMELLTSKDLVVATKVPSRGRPRTVYGVATKAT
jgi:hypothetical protein